MYLQASEVASVISLTSSIECCNFTVGLCNMLLTLLQNTVHMLSSIHTHLQQNVLLGLQDCKWTTVGLCHGPLWAMDHCGSVPWTTVGLCHGPLWVCAMDHSGSVPWTTLCHGPLWVCAMDHSGSVPWTTVGHGPLWVCAMDHSGSVPGCFGLPWHTHAPAAECPPWIAGLQVDHSGSVPGCFDLPWGADQGGYYSAGQTSSSAY